MLLKLLLTMILTNGVFPLALMALLAARDRREPARPRGDLFLGALLLAPALVTLILYYALAAIPGLAPLWYVALVGALFTGIGVGAGASGWRQVGVWSGHACRRMVQRPGILCAGLFLAASAFWLYAAHVWPRWFDSYDVSQYAAYGAGFADDRSVRPYFQAVHPVKGYAFDAIHAPSFSLLLTWERLLPGGGDWWFKAQCAWYGMLTLALAYRWLARLDPWLGVTAVVAILSGSYWFRSLVTLWNLDTYRIGLLMLSWACLAQAVARGDRLAMLMTGVCSGLAAFAHSIGVFAALANVAVVWWWTEGPWLTRMERALQVAGLALLFGGIHYLAISLWGRGWLV